MCFIIPPSVQKHIEDNVEPAKKFRARKARLLAEKIQKAREAGTTAVEPQAGEQREVREGDNQEKTDGPVIRAEDSPDLAHDPGVNAIYDMEGWTYDFYVQVLKRAGPSGDGRPMVSVARFGDHWDNAAFSEGLMLVGWGDIFPELWKALATVDPHERGHEETAQRNGLGYRKWPGHLNEGGSDIRGVIVDMWRLQVLPKDYHWLIGRELFSEGLQGRAIRDMRRKRNGPAFDDPVLGPDPQFVDMDDFVENSDPHRGSSIPNGAFAEACVQHGGQAWEAMGQLHDTVWGRMTPTTTGPQYAQMILDLATERFGVNSRERDAWAYGFDYVKLVPATGPAPDPVPESPCDIPLPQLLDLGRAVVATIQAHPVGKKLWAVGRTLNKKETR